MAVLGRKEGLDQMGNVLKSGQSIRCNSDSPSLHKLSAAHDCKV
jgi:hypothetical protein